MASPIPYHDFKRKFNHYGVSLEKGKGSHIKMSQIIDGTKVMYPVAVHGNKVEYLYVEKARKRFRLTPKWGVTNDDFRKA